MNDKLERVVPNVPDDCAPYVARSNCCAYGFFTINFDLYCGKCIVIASRTCQYFVSADKAEPAEDV